MHYHLNTRWFLRIYNRLCLKSLLNQLVNSLQWLSNSVNRCVVPRRLDGKHVDNHPDRKLKFSDLIRDLCLDHDPANGMCLELGHVVLC